MLKFIHLNTFICFFILFFYIPYTYVLLDTYYLLFDFASAKVPVVGLIKDLLSYLSFLNHSWCRT